MFWSCLNITQLDLFQFLFLFTAISGNTNESRLFLVHTVQKPSLMRLYIHYKQLVVQFGFVQTA